MQRIELAGRWYAVRFISTYQGTDEYGICLCSPPGRSEARVAFDRSGRPQVPHDLEHWPREYGISFPLAMVIVHRFRTDEFDRGVRSIVQREILRYCDDPAVTRRAVVLGLAHLRLYRGETSVQSSSGAPFVDWAFALDETHAREIFANIRQHSGIPPEATTKVRLATTDETTAAGRRPFSRRHLPRVPEASARASLPRKWSSPDP